MVSPPSFDGVALKRKAAGSPKSESAPKKRSTRAPVLDEDDSSPPPAPVKKTKSKSSTSASTSSKKDKGKTKQKKEEVITISSDVEAEDSDVVVEKPKKKKAAPVKKTKAKTPAASTSTIDKDKEKAVAKNQSSKVIKASKAKPLPFEEAFPAWFSQFAEEGEPDKMGGEGIEKLFEDMELSMEGAHPFILAYRVGAALGTFGSFLRDDFKRTFQPFNIASSAALSGWLAKAHDEIMDSADEYEFRRFYAFVFPFLKNEGAKTIPGEMAVAMWGTVLAPKYPLAESFVEYATSQGEKFKAVSLDVWTQLLEFCETVQPDLTGWSEDDAWPSTIDSFVEWKKQKDASS
ncbi:Defective in cullin neddylation protein [Rhodotorula toruloides]|nr:Defective in cullin neddylation protein [Rhodotorula toruloides]